MSSELNVPPQNNLIPGWTTFGRIAQSNAYKDIFIPQRLQGSFMNTPWPKHDLGERIVDTYYTPRAQPQTTDPQSILEITHERQCSIDGESLRLFKGGLRLRFMNVMLLTRGFYVRSDEFAALAGLAANARNKQESQQARRNFIQRSHSDTLVAIRTLDGQPQRPHYATRLHPGAVVIDRRDA